jgi:predicted RNase H-like HicB family nuclease
MNAGAKYAKIVEWSDVDECFVGSAPNLIYGCCHGANEREVFEELCVIVEEAVESYRLDGRKLPPATAGKDLANRLQDVA